VLNFKHSILSVQTWNDIQRERRGGNLLFQNCTISVHWVLSTAAYYRGADKSLAGPGWKQAAATEDFDVHITYILS
jgi:hypothetical protein